MLIAFVGVIIKVSLSQHLQREIQQIHQTSKVTERHSESKMMLNEFIYRKDNTSKAHRKKGTRIKKPICVVFRVWSTKKHTRRVAHIDI